MSTNKIKRTTDDLEARIISSNSVIEAIENDNLIVYTDGSNNDMANGQ